MNIESKRISAMRKDAEEIFSRALQAVEPGAAVMRYCRLDGERLGIGHRTYSLDQYENMFVVGAGKATAPMAAAIERILAKRITGGIVIVKYGHVAGLEQISLIEAGHPLPDENGKHGAGDILNCVKNAEKNDIIICLISGGGSALLPLPYNGISLADKQDTIQQLLSCGATIHETK